jgi:hypothetical protein
MDVPQLESDMTDKEIIKMLDLIIKWANDLAAAARTVRSLIEDEHTDQTIYQLNCGKIVEYRIHHIDQTMGVVMLALRKKEDDRIAKRWKENRRK